MTNGEKYKTAQEREEAFTKRYSHMADYNLGVRDFSRWLDLEAEEEKTLPCPFCGLVPVSFIDDKTRKAWVACTCGYQSPEYKSESLAIAAHNRVAKKCREGKVNED